MSDGFNTSELDDFMKDMMSLANDKMPKESKNFVKKEAKKLNSKNKSVYKSKGIGEETGNLLAGFSSGKAYKFDEAWSARAYNSSPHAHLLNSGWMWTPKKGQNGQEHFIPGFHFIDDAAKEFESTYNQDSESFVDNMLEKGL